MSTITTHNSSYSIYDLESSYYQLWENRDLRVEDKFFVFSSYGLASPLIPCSIVATYLLLITCILPKFMENRKPFHMKGILLVYNFIQVVLSCLCVYYMWVGGGHGSYFCHNVEYHTDPGSTGMLMLTGAYTYYTNKYVELLDTVFFALRKKWNQISFLHVYHHAIMPLYMFIGVRWLPGGHIGFGGGLLNSLVHVVMYSYYLLAALEVPQKYLWWKKYLTLFQIVQFILLFGQGTIFLLGYALDLEYAKCGYPWQMSALGLAILYGPFLIMFSKFYSASYTKKSSKKEN